ncbi:MAG: phosphonate ABC transporter ATP-binding protein [Propioniciclava sp.]
MTVPTAIRATHPAPQRPAPWVEICDLRVAYGDHVVLDGVSLELVPGEVVSLLGSSGSGKSTLMKALTGFAPITAGEAVVAGRPVRGVGRRGLRQLRSDVGQIFQQFNLVGRLSVLTNVLTGALHHAGPINLVGGFTSTQRRLAMHYLDRVGIADKAAAPARTLSGGQQQRVAIARALMQQPKVILADEPVASLDPRLADAVLDLLRDIARADHIPVLVSLHVLPLALAHGDRVVGLRRGAMVVSDQADRLDAEQLQIIYADDEEGHHHDGR